MRILVVDDESEMTALLARGLTAEGHLVTTALDGHAALAKVRSTGAPDVAIVDVMMPRIDGLELSRRLRAEHPSVDIILLTARGALGDRVAGLDAGADDYMVKPFEFAELAARIRAIERRRAAAPSTTLRLSDVTVDTRRRRASVHDQGMSLSPTEFDLLRALLAADGTVTRDTLLRDVWGTSEHVGSNVVDQYVSALRRKLAAAGSTLVIETVRGIGFRTAPAALP